VHHCPSHDLAGWRKDAVTHFLRLQRAGVRFYWIIDPEGRALIAYTLDAGGYRTCFTAEGPEETAVKARIPPFLIL
jgi:hypothetical protein